VLSEEDSSSSQAEETLSNENARGMADTVSWHTLLGASPVYAIGGNEDEIKSAETDPSLDGNNNSVNLGSAQGTLSAMPSFCFFPKLSGERKRNVMEFMMSHFSEGVGTASPCRLGGMRDVVHYLKIQSRFCKCLDNLLYLGV
jgi:hypothetical protein